MSADAPPPASAPLPNDLPRPAAELQQLQAAWQPPRGWRLASSVNNTHIGLFYIGTALLFFVLAGVLALLMRAQLAVPGNTLVGAATYNQLFTMHGTVMMFLFAVPVVEAMAVYLLPAMLGARDLPFPRLSAYAFWAYAIGGLCLLLHAVLRRGARRRLVHVPAADRQVPVARASAPTSGCSASASSRSRRSPARSN